MGWFMGSSGVTEDDKLDFAGTRAVLARTIRLSAPWRRNAVLAGLFLVASTASILAGPILVRRAIDKGLIPGDAGQLNLSIALYVVAAVTGYFTFRMAIASLARYGENVLRFLRTRVFRSMLDQSMPFYDRENAGVLVSRMTSDIDSLRDLVQLGLLMLSAATLLLASSLVTLALLSPKLLLISLATIPFVALATVKFHRDSNRAYLQVRDRVGTTLSSLQEGISGVRIVQAFGREDAEASRFSDTNNELYRTHMRSVFVGAWYLPIVEFAGAVTMAIALGVGGWMVSDGQLTLGTVAAFILLLQSMFGPVQQLSQLFNLVQSATAALSKLYGLMDEVDDVPEAADGQSIPARGEVVLSDVSFAYAGGEPVLSGVDLRIGKGERIAFVGPTGAGKSTLAKLIARFYDPTSGTITVGGVDLRDARRSSMRERVVVVPQEGFLFAGSVVDNIRLARPETSRADVVKALEGLGIRGRFEQLPDGLDTEVNERGSRLSGGERQLVSLARAALADPGVLILDEATSSVDPGTEALVERAMDALMADRTVIVIAHRLSTSERCDRVAVVADGHLAEVGPHDDLVRAGGHYAELFAAWERGLAS